MTVPNDSCIHCDRAVMGYNADDDDDDGDNDDNGNHDGDDDIDYDDNLDTTYSTTLLPPSICDPIATYKHRATPTIFPTLVLPP